MQLSFGSGAVWGERTDVTGSGIGPISRCTGSFSSPWR